MKALMLVGSSCVAVVCGVLNIFLSSSLMLPRVFARGFFPILLFLVFVGCGGAEAGTNFEAEAGSIVLTSPSAQVAARFDGFIFVQAEINGVVGNFILDSGAEAFFVSEEFAARLGLPPTGTVPVTTIAGTSEVTSYRVDSFRIANVVGAELEAAAVNLSGMDGIIGLPLFREVVVIVDYGNQQVFFEDPSATDLAILQAQRGGSVFEAPEFIIDDLTVNGMQVGSVRIDSGSNGGIRLDQSNGAQLLPGAGTTTQVTSVSSNGSVVGTAFIARELSFAGFLVPLQYVIVQSPNLPVGLMGNLVLQQFFIGFDLKRNQVLLRQDRHLRYNLIDRTPFRTPRALFG